MSHDNPIEHQPDVIDVEVGANVRARRRQLGISQEALGDAVGLTFQQIQKYESGRNRISCSKLVHIANALRCDPADLLRDVGASATSGDGTADRPANWLEAARAVNDKASGLIDDLARCSRRHLAQISGIVSAVASATEARAPLEAPQLQAAE